MKKALVLGGTRFFGKRLVESLLDEGVDVTIATRGETKDPFGSEVNRVIYDRENLDSFKYAFKDSAWDVVYDQICYASQDAMDAIEVFEGKTDKYIMTSSNAVYEMKEAASKEDDFNPYQHAMVPGSRNHFTYAEGKRQAEAAFYQNASFLVVSVRFPFVMGVNDYTKRLNFHIERNLKGEPIGFSNLKAKANFILETEAGKFLARAGQIDIAGPVNACSENGISMEELVSYIENATGKKSIITDVPENGNRSPYDILGNWIMNNEKARIWGYEFQNPKQWLPELNRKVAEIYL
ncbi:MAG: NAD-dependent epimerase/dehydratase family protein [Tuberibacillus sp.]